MINEIISHTIDDYRGTIFIEASYNKNDITKIITEAKKINAKIITTEKDYVKINSDDKEKINFLEIELEIKKKDILLNFIKNKL